MDKRQASQRVVFKALAEGFRHEQVNPAYALKLVLIVILWILKIAMEISLNVSTVDMRA